MLDPHAPSEDYALRWPRAVFVAEARAVLANYTPVLDAGEQAQGAVSASTMAAYLLARHAFVGNQPATDLGRGQVPLSWPPDQPRLTRGLLAMTPSPRRYLDLLVDVADRLPEQPPRLYWTARTAPGVRLKHDWATLVDEMRREGFLDRAARSDCPRDDFAPSQYSRLHDLTIARIGPPPPDPTTSYPCWWPLQPDSWDEPTFYALVEVVHDLVARPRLLHPHEDQAADYDLRRTADAVTGLLSGVDPEVDCHGHYADFATAAGRAVYRWRVDHLLAQHQALVRFDDDVNRTAASGAVGTRLVTITGDDRDGLVHRVLATPATLDQDAVRHAVARFRTRDATRDDKRSAVFTLARILESRRTLLKTELLSKDEGALFQIANQFDIRHRNADQRPSYDDGYLDWIFWWYLATVELTNQLLTRPTHPTGQPPTQPPVAPAPR